MAEQSDYLLMADKLAELHGPLREVEDELSALLDAETDNTTWSMDAATNLVTRVLPGWDWQGMDEGRQRVRAGEHLSRR
jgi:hypothetical protein